MKTPVLLLVYNRPEHTERVLKRLKECSVDEVYVSADGPKNTADSKLTSEVKNVLQRYDSIIVKTRFSELNIGCKNAVVSGIDWFFNHIEEGIILEDDCLPSEHFFPFALDMLNRYREEQKVMMVGGNNPLGNWQSEGGHFFSRIGTIWGWTTWKNRWQSFNVELPQLNAFIDNSGFEKSFGPTDLAHYRKEVTLKAAAGKIDTWDYQWNAHILMNNGLAVIPENNLVGNIGFDALATNDRDLPNWIDNSVSAESVSVSVRKIEIDREYEMEWHLARRSNSAANASSFSFEKKGGTEERKLKIVLVNSTDVGGGAEKIAFTLHQKLIELGHESTLLVGVKKSDLESVQQIGNWKAELQELKPDVIHVHNLHGMSIGLSDLAEASQQYRTLFTLHDSWLATGSTAHPFEPKATNLSLLELKNWKAVFEDRKNLIAASNIRFTAPSQWMRQLFYNAHGTRPFFIQNAIEKGKSANVEIPSKRFIVFVANNPESNPYKDFATLKKAWKMANRQLAENGVDLIVIGGDSKVKRHGVHTIYFIEKCDSDVIMKFMEKAELLVHASKQDNAPLTILEAHSCHTKVFASLVGGIPELLDNEERKWLYEPENADDLCEKLIHSLTRGKRDKLISDKVVATSESMLETYLGHYHDLTSA